jgi:hypothetical protein
MSDQTKLSFGAKTLILEVSEPLREGSLSRREFLERSLITVGGLMILSIVLPTAGKSTSEAATCTCYTACYVNCHTDCGRKTW